MTLESYWQGFDGLFSQLDGDQRGPMGRCRRDLCSNNDEDDHGDVHEDGGNNMGFDDDDGNENPVIVLPTATNFLNNAAN